MKTDTENKQDEAPNASAVRDCPDSTSYEHSLTAPPLARLLKFVQQHEGRSLELDGENVWLNDRGIWQVVCTAEHPDVTAPTHDSMNGGLPLFPHNSN